MKDKIAVIFDDHKLFSETFASWLKEFGLFKSVTTVATKVELFQLLTQTKGTSICLFADYYLEEGNTLTTLSSLKRIYPTTVIIILSKIMDPATIRKLLELKPNGFLSKVPGIDEVLLCLQKINNNESYISTYILDILNASADDKTVASFTTREVKILDYFARGNSVIKTAELMGLSKHTVVSQRRKMMEKANCKSLAGLLYYARAAKLIS